MYDDEPTYTLSVFFGGTSSSFEKMTTQIGLKI